jgi:hypothetical protein
MDRKEAAGFCSSINRLTPARSPHSGVFVSVPFTGVGGTDSDLDCAATLSQLNANEVRIEVYSHVSGDGL